MPVHDDILELVGSTPCVRIRRSLPADAAHVYAKLEFFNPGRSVKDRCALGVLEEAERTGRLDPGGTIIEATSGNTGIALALAAAVRGYRLIVTIPRKMSQDKIRLLKALGAEVHVTENLPHDHPDSNHGLAARLTEEIEGAVFLDQCSNPGNVRAHHATGREILADVPDVDAIVVGAGTGGTITGIAEVVRSEAPHVEIVGVEPVGSVFSGRSASDYLVEGIGYDFVPQTLRPELIDSWHVVADREAFVAARSLATREGLFVGGSSGAAFVAARKVAVRLGRGRNVVTLFADGGERYLSTFHDVRWMAQHFPEETVPAPARAVGPAPVGVLR
jgi:cystathionine beta-synthase